MTGKARSEIAMAVNRKYRLGAVVVYSLIAALAFWLTWTIGGR